MIGLSEIGAALSTSGTPREMLKDLGEDELYDLRDETESDGVIAAIDEELASRSKPGGSRSGTIIWLVVLVALVGSIVAVVRG